MNSKLSLNITNEVSQLSKVIVGQANNFKKPNISDLYDPTSIVHLKNNTYPKKKDLIKELNFYKNALRENNVEVIELDSVKDCNQIFARDIGFVIDDFFFISNILPHRKNEIKGLESIINMIDKEKIIRLKEDIHVEGGDIIVGKDKLYIGYYDEADYEQQITARTNFNAIIFFKNFFTKKDIVPLKLKKSSIDPEKNALHLDCCFQPVGNKYAVICKDGFYNCSDYNLLVKDYGVENVLNITSKEMSEMHCNFFSISEKIVISDFKFKKLNSWLEERKIKVVKVKLNEVGKQGGLFRCSTLPLIRLR